AHLDAENAYAQAVLSPTERLQRELFAEMLARSGADDAPPPYPMGPWVYYYRFPPNTQYASWYRRRRNAPSGEQLLLDGSKRAHGRPGFKIVNPTPSPDHALF